MIKYVAYNVCGKDKKGEFNIFRRYNEFYELRKLLVQNWPGMLIPPIP